MFRLSLALFLFTASRLCAQQERVDLNAIYKIKTAEFGFTAGKPNSQLADLAFHLTDLYGPRLTNSPQFRRAADWAIKQLRDWGIGNVHTEKWTAPANSPRPSWECTYFNASMVEPTYQQLIGGPQPWTPATPGSVTAEVIVPHGPDTLEEIESMRGKYTGKILLGGTGAPTPLPLPEASLVQRYTPEELAKRSAEKIRVLNPFPPSPAPSSFDAEIDKKIDEFWVRENPLAVIMSGDGMPSPVPFQGGTFLSVFRREGPPPSTTVFLAAEHYNRIARLVARNIPVKVQLEIRTAVDESFKDESFNIIGEIPGGSKKDEVVMVGAHLDSWAAGTGATDNGIGCAVIMEAMRILHGLKLPMDRTVRMALWSGEEGGVLGSKGYVKEHAADLHEKLSVYLNLDHGTGRIQGIYLRHNQSARPIFEDWFASMKDLTLGAVLIRNDEEDMPGQGSDHMSFDAAGLPAFSFLQDALDFDTRTRHTNMDTFDRIQFEDAEQMAVVVASFLYNAATRPDKLPRKE